MKRMGLFLTYALCIIGFIFLSYILEDGLIEGMYKKVSGAVDSSGYDISVSDVKAKASTVNGNLQFTLKNNSGDTSNCFAKIDLFNKRGALVATEYIPVKDLEPDSNKSYNVKFNGNNIADYKISMVDEMPDDTNKLKIFGWEFDLTNVFGHDLSDTKIFGKNIKDIFSLDNAKNTIKKGWTYSVGLAKSIPLWGYVAAAGIILWYLPSGYILGII